jgi:hypothetical protein
LEKISDAQYGTGSLSCRKILLTADRGVSFEALQMEIETKKRSGKSPTFFKCGKEIACCFGNEEPMILEGMKIECQTYRVLTPWRCELVSFEIMPK